MTTKRKYTPYTIPSAWKGDTLEKVTQKFDQSFIQAVTELADEETKRWGSKHGVAAVITNITLRNTDYFRTKRAQLRKRYLQLKTMEKNQRERQAQEQEVEAEFRKRCERQAQEQEVAAEFR
jgi:hypothetical protein